MFDPSTVGNFNYLDSNPRFNDPQVRNCLRKGGMRIVTEKG